MLYFGGHVRSEDQVSEDGCLNNTFERTLSRELGEELNVNLVPMDAPPVCVWDRENNPGANHFAIIYVVEVDFERFKFLGDQHEFQSTKLKILDKNDILNKKIGDYETWSRIIIEKILNWEINLDLQLS